MTNLPTMKLDRDDWRARPAAPGETGPGVYTVDLSEAELLTDADPFLPTPADPDDAEPDTTGLAVLASITPCVVGARPEPYQFRLPELHEILNAAEMAR